MAPLLATVARAADYDDFEYQGFNFTVISEADHYRPTAAITAIEKRLPHMKSCNVTVIDPSGVDAVITDADAPVEVFNLQGVAVLRGAAASDLGNLPAGLYIVRQGKVTKKVLVK